MSKILLYYKYVDLENPHAIKTWQQNLCASLNLKGRIILAHEGINGTLGGDVDALQAYIDAMNNHPLFGDIDFKESPGNANHFPRMRIVVRQEIVSMGIDPKAVTVKDTGKHLTPAQAHELMAKKNKDLIILDTRNLYESVVGTFENAVKADINNFREFPEYIDKNLEDYKDKEVLMFCTGGVRCERATAYLQQKGVAKEIYQIEGGIHRYAEQFPNGFFRGKNYVFDGRVAVRVNDDILAQCSICSKPCDDYNNCINTRCNKHFIGCDDCLQKYSFSCGTQCHELVTTGKVPLRKLFNQTEINHANNRHTK